MKPSPRYWEKSQPATMVACAEPATRPAAANDTRQVAILNFIVLSLSWIRVASAGPATNVEIAHAVSEVAILIFMVGPLEFRIR
jgi:hypothetical protein